MKITETDLGKIIETDMLILGAGAAGSGRGPRLHR
jgi:hypothetical protein